MDRELILAVAGLGCRYADAARDALCDVSLEVRAGEFHAVLGPNGSGKTTLVRAGLGLIRPSAGRAEVLGRPATGWSRRELARVVGVVPQREDNLFPQRVRLARALAQEPKLLVLDEPTTSLDVRHEMQLFELTRALVDAQGLAALVITHHVNLAARFADQVLLLSEGRAVARGAPGDVLTAETVQNVFAWPMAITSFDGRPQMIPLRTKETNP